MRLSEAIRLGAMTTEPLVGRMVSRDESAACALGAATIAVGCRPYAIFNAFPILAKPADWPCPCVRLYRPHVADVIAHLNDIHGWSREQIADFVQAVEARHAVEQEVASVR